MENMTIQEAFAVVSEVMGQPVNPAGSDCRVVRHLFRDDGHKIDTVVSLRVDLRSIDSGNGMALRVTVDSPVALTGLSAREALQITEQHLHIANLAVRVEDVVRGRTWSFGEVQGFYAASREGE